jgi:acetyl esterase
MATHNYEALDPNIWMELKQSPLISLQKMQGLAPCIQGFHDVLLDCGTESMHVRLFQPLKPLPRQQLIVFYHGGGWVRGDLDLYEIPCRTLAAVTCCAVAFVPYRLAPVHRFPVGLNDCFRATQALALRAAEWGCDTSKVIVAGDSAGGNLAASVCLMARQLGWLHISHQILVYPPLDASMISPSYKQHENAPFLTTADMVKNFAAYAGTADLRDSLISPLNSISLENLPSATIITAEFDPVRDDGMRYAIRLGTAGVNVHYTCVLNIPHMAFHMFGVSRACAEIYKLIGQRVRELL